MQKIFNFLACFSWALLLTACGEVKSPPSTSTGGSDLSLKKYFAASPTPAVYRFAKLSNGAYFYTGSDTEAQTIFQQYPDFRYEGVAFARDVGGNGQPIYRFANLQNGGYFYTGSAEERDVVIRDYPHMRFEGTTFAVAPAQQNSAPPVYRLANLSNGAYLFTQSAEERDYAVSLGMWRSEGSTFRANAVAVAAPVASPDAYRGYFAADWGTPAPFSIDETIGRHTCLTPPAGEVIQFAPVGPFVRYSGDCLLSYTISAAKFADFKQSMSNFSAFRAEVSKAASKSFHDHFDWIFLVYDYADTAPPGTNPYGAYLSTGSRKAGRPRRLMGTVMLPFLDGFDLAPVLH